MSFRVQYFVAEFISPKKVYTFSFIVVNIIPKSVKCIHPATKNIPCTPQGSSIQAPLTNAEGKNHTEPLPGSAWIARSQQNPLVKSGLVFACLSDHLKGQGT